VPLQSGPALRAVQELLTDRRRHFIRQMQTRSRVGEVAGVHPLDTRLGNHIDGLSVGSLVDLEDPDNILLPAERAKRAENARKAYYQRLALKSAQARRRRRN
jgi:hypothetical protein